jgi:putative ABC transport system permease protein
MSVPLARRQLLARPGRMLAGLAGIAVALLLVLALQAIFAGIEQRLTVKIDASGADVIVAQAGVETMHMTESALPLEAVPLIEAVHGVAAARPMLLVGATAESGGATGRVELIGQDGDFPLPLVAGRRPRGPEIVVDRALAGALDAELGSTIRVLEEPLRLVGEIEGTASLAGSIALADRAHLGRMLRSERIAHYVLVRAQPGVPPAELAGRLEQAVPGITATVRGDFAESERRVAGDMATDIVRGMIVVGFVIGVAVAALVAYGATLAQLRDYAVLRAIGLRARRALALVLAQVGALVAAGFLLALALVALLALILPALSATLVLDVRAADVARTLGVAGAVAAAAALVPVLRVVRVDPASVFRR